MSTIETRWGGNMVGDYFVDTESGRKFRRIVGGYAWPGKRPGFGVAVAEELDPDPNTKRRHLRVVGETENPNVEVLTRRAIEFFQLYHVEAFYGDTTKESMLKLVRHLGLSPREAPCVDKEDSFSFYMATIRGYLEPEKYLHFGENSKLPGYLLEVTLENVSQGAEGFPAVAALGYAVSYLMVQQRTLPPLREPQRNIAKTYVPHIKWPSGRSL